MKVVLTEKPSVAREIARFLGASDRHEGYFQGQGYQVTWAFGHLVELKEPEDYDPALKKWSLEVLPFVPAKFELKLRNERGSRHQYDVIARLFRRATELIAATDAGREGELIFRYILAMTGCLSKPARRLWLSSLTPAAIREAFDRLKPLAEYDSLYAAAQCRSQADWIVGLNATRNLTVRYGDRGLLWSVGRVQTPVLAMIVQRDQEIQTFRPEPFWELLTKYRQTQFRCDQPRFSEEAKAQERLQQVQGHDLVIEKIERRQEKSLPPQLYDLTELQRDMNRRYGLSAAATLRCAQSLYERKLITYPRTDSRYLSSDMKSELVAVLRQLADLKPQEIERLDLSQLPLSRRLINDQKVSDHHAIIPTTTKAPTLSGADAKVYDAIVTRLIAALYPPCLKDVTKIKASSNKVPFKTQGVRVVSPGWTQLYPRAPREADDQDSQLLPDFQVGERGPHAPRIKAGQTSPPKPFTENSLLGAMETAGKAVEEERLREALREKGLGTPATRAAIIETLLNRNYISRTRKQLQATDLGRYLVALVQDDQLKSPELTGEWEARLNRIQRGEANPSDFLSEIIQYTTTLISRSDIARLDENRLGPCPRCGREVIRGKRDFGCSGWRDGCSFILPAAYQDHELSLTEVRALLQHRITTTPLTIADQPPAILTLLDGGQLLTIRVPSAPSSTRPQKRAGKSSSPSRVTKRKAEHTRHQPSPSAAARSLGRCPQCGAAVTEQPKSFSCSRWQDSCPLVIWKKIAGKRISARTAKTLLSHGRTASLKGFKSKSGKPFSARLKLEEGLVKFDFGE